MKNESAKQLIRVILVDDHFVVRMGLASSLDEEEDISIIGEAASVEEALNLFEEKQPDVAVVDMRLQDGEGWQLIKVLQEKHPSVRCLVLSVNTGENDILQAVKAGAKGYLSKAAERPELLEAIRTIAEGGDYFPASIRKILDVGTARPNLTAREFDVLELVVKGMLNKEIADKLGLAEITVKQHVSAVLRKLDVQDRTQAAIASVERGLIRLGDRS